MKDVIEECIEDWLRAALVELNGKLISIGEILELSDKLEALERAWNFKVLTDIWVSFKSEEADVRIKIGCREFSVGVCLSPIPWKFEKLR